jgi:hypothetical protein
LSYIDYDKTYLAVVIKKPEIGETGKSAVFEDPEIYVNGKKLEVFDNIVIAISYRKGVAIPKIILNGGREIYDKI